MEKKVIHTDVLIIGGGTAGCYGAYTIGKESNYKVVIAEKANIRRSGCLAAGVNALNAYITEGRTPRDYVDYCKKDAKKIVREDLLLSLSENLNEVTKVLEDHGLVILKDEQGKYAVRGNRNIKINGENIKPILSEMASESENVTILNHVNITDYIVDKNRIYGAVGFDVNERVAYVLYAKAVLIATGGAAGIYRPNNPGFSRHKMWYPPFNTGAGYAMGIEAGAEMTTLEMRFIALRCKDTIAPTGTIAQGVGAKQMNAVGEIYETRYGVATCERVYGTTKEIMEGRGPCYLKTEEISKEMEEDLYRAYLNMAPSQTLRWLEGGQGPSDQNVEIEGTEPYIVGGHTASGYWVDNHRATTIKGLYAAGDVAGGAPQKYVTGAMAEGKIAARSLIEYLNQTAAANSRTEAQYETAAANSRIEARYETAAANSRIEAQYETAAANSRTEAQYEYTADESLIESAVQRMINGYEKYLSNKPYLLTIEQAEEAMQKIMDAYAGGIGSYYQFNETGLRIAKEKLKALEPVLESLHAEDMDDLLQIYEIRERVTVAFSLIEHLMARKETRWHSFAENMNYRKEDTDFETYVNSYKEDGEIKVILRNLVTEEYEPVTFLFDDNNRVIQRGGGK